jgi:hypothetical protein
MKSGHKELLKTATASVGGGAAGAAAYNIIGGVGITALGTGVGVTLAPFIVIGAGLGAVVYGVYWLGKERKNKTNP